MKCLVTGANGFVGSELVAQLSTNIDQVSVAVRTQSEKAYNLPVYLVDRINGETNWTEPMAGQDTVIHLANRAHVFKDQAQDPLAEYREINVQGTVALARQAVEAGVKRYIYLSSIKVNGEQTLLEPYSYKDTPSPQDPYAVSKWEAEQALKELCENSSMELVIIRPPLVYGPGVKGNLRTLRSAIDRGWPLPLAGIENQRDLISLRNLVDLISVCIKHPDAAGHTFLCSDDRPVSTTELITAIAKARHRKPKLFKMPPKLLASLAKLAGKEGAYERLFGDLRVDISHTKNVLGWEPRFTFEEAILDAFKPERDITEQRGYG